MREAVASHAHHMPQACTAQDAERRREQLDDLELLIEKLIERVGQVERELRDVTRERDRYRDELERLKGG